VSVDITSTPPVKTCGDEPGAIGSGHVNATLTRIAGGRADSVQVVLDLVSGDPSAGVWDGASRVGAGRCGTWQITNVRWCNGSLGGDGGYVVDPRTNPGYTQTLTVVATAAPHVTTTRIPRIAAFGAHQWMRVTYETSAGTPLAGRLVAFGAEVDCGLYGDEGTTRRLDASGSVVVRLHHYPVCLFPVEPQSRWVTSSTTVIRADFPAERHYYAVVSAKAASASFPISLGARVPTSTAPALGVVSLQVLTGRTWHTINTRAAASRLNLHVPAGVRELGDGRAPVSRRCVPRTGPGRPLGAVPQQDSHDDGCLSLPEAGRPGRVFP